MINKLIETLEIMNKLKGFKNFKIEFKPDEVRNLYFELLELQHNLSFMIDLNDKKQHKIDKVINLINDIIDDEFFVNLTYKEKQIFKIKEELIEGDINDSDN